MGPAARPAHGLAPAYLFTKHLCGAERVPPRSLGDLQGLTWARQGDHFAELMGERAAQPRAADELSQTADKRPKTADELPRALRGASKELGGPPGADVGTSG